MWVCVCMKCVSLQASTESPGPGVVGNWPQVLWKGSMCSYLLSHLSRPHLVLILLFFNNNNNDISNTIYGKVEQLNSKSLHTFHVDLLLFFCLFVCFLTSCLLWFGHSSGCVFRPWECRLQTPGYFFLT